MQTEEQRQGRPRNKAEETLGAEEEGCVNVPLSAGSLAPGLIASSCTRWSLGMRYSTRRNFTGKVYC